MNNEKTTKNVMEDQIWSDVCPNAIQRMNDRMRIVTYEANRFLFEVSRLCPFIIL
jgi:hypothetical protein